MHKLVSNKYSDEGTLFWTFFKYLDNCFIEGKLKFKTLNECFDWSTVIIDNVEEVDSINSCFKNSFEVSNDLESQNNILLADKVWSDSLNLVFHPSIVINNATYNGDVNGEKLAFAICAAFKEKPDECDLSWNI